MQKCSNACECQAIYLALTSRHQNVDSENAVLLDGELLDFLVLLGSLDDDLVAVDDVLLHVVRENPLDELDAILLSDEVNNLCDLAVLHTGSDHALRSVASGVCSCDDISSLIADLGLLWRGNDDGERVEGSKAADLSTKLDLDDIAGLQGDLLVALQRAEMTTDVVDGDAGREGDALLGLGVSLGELVEDSLISGLAEVEDAYASLDGSDNLGECVAGDFASLSVQLDNLGVGQINDL